MTHISAEQRQVIARLAPLLPADAYLAGGVAAAAWLNHRSSLDVDLFTETTDPISLLNDFSRLPNVKVLSRAPGTLELEVDELPVSILAFPYPNLVAAAPRDRLAVPCASAKDLTAMKLSAIAGRGAAKDFWDLHSLVRFRQIDLRHALDEFERKFSAHDSGSVIRSLAYFGDADAEPLPRGLTQQHWQSIKHDVCAWVVAL